MASEQHSELWHAIRNHEKDCAIFRGDIRERLAKLETRQIMLTRISWTMLAVLVTSQAHRLFT